MNPAHKFYGSHFEIVRAAVLWRSAALVVPLFFLPFPAVFGGKTQPLGSMEDSGFIVAGGVAALVIAAAACFLLARKGSSRCGACGFTVAIVWAVGCV